MIVVHAKCRILPDCRAGFIDEVRKIIPLVRGEDGCRRYELVSDMFEPDTFLFVEAWESEEHLDRHLVCPHMKDYFSRTAKCHSAPTELMIYDIRTARSVIL